ncbi:MAG: hypothetical protein Tsb0034_28800 [Ekhidna sp.]
MKLLFIIYSVILFTATSSHRSLNDASVARGSGAKKATTGIKMDENWPFRDTLQHTDPFLSELIKEAE